MLGQCQESSVKKLSLSFSIFFLAVILGLGAGCSKKPDDAKLASDIQSKFSQDSGLSGKQLSVQASEGTVTIAGTVDNDSQREAASRQAASVPGVKQGINNLQGGTAPIAASVEPPAPSPSPSTQSKPEPRRREKKSHKSHTAENTGMNDGGSAMNDKSGDTTANNSAPPAQPTPQLTPPPTPAPPPQPKKR